MSKYRIVLLACAVLPFLPGAALAQTELSPFASCDSRFAIIFPGGPMRRDTVFTTAAGATVPARQFYFERGADRFAVTVVNLANGPALDEPTIDHAADLLRKKGEVKMQFPVGYIDGVRGRQILVAEPNNRQLRGSVYMHDHRVYITEVSSAVGDISALQFDQSITIIDGTGTDIDRGQAGNAERKFTCR